MAKPQEVRPPTYSELIERYLRIEGDTFSFKGREYLVPVYDCQRRNRILRTGRQVEKSSTLSCLMVIRSVSGVGRRRSLYAAPTYEQSLTFSNDYLAPRVMDSPLIRSLFFDERRCRWQARNRGFLNKSQIYIRSLYKEAYRVRGLSIHDLYLDELQDLLKDDIIVAEECMGAGHREEEDPQSSRFYSGTPRTTDNVIEEYWSNSTQKEWIMACECGHQNLPGWSNIKPKGLSCEKCDRLLDKRRGYWARMGKEDAYFDGYHISQLMVPWMKWAAILAKYETYPIAKFHNEVLGIPYDISQKPIHEREIINACELNAATTWYHNRLVPPEDYIFHGVRIAGLDIGKGNIYGDEDIASYTVLTIINYYLGKKITVCAKKFMGPESDPAVYENAVVEICRAWHVDALFIDAASFGTQSSLAKRLNRVFAVMYVQSGKDVKEVRYDRKSMAYQVNRTSTITHVLENIKKGGLKFFNWDEFKPLAKDILSVTVEHSEATRRMYYGRSKGTNDDFLHSLNYAMVGVEIWNKGYGTI